MLKTENKNKGFSLVELVITIAILAVLAAVLVASLLHNVEKSRSTSDVHTMDEVIHAVQLSLSNSEAYDEMAAQSVEGNVACYIDSESEAGREKQIIKINTDGTVQYMFGDDERLLDEKPYATAGSMRGVTITFIPKSSDDTVTYDLKDGIINKFVGGNKKLDELPNVYNSVRQSIGDTIALESQTYGNSQFTIFIRIGTIGGKESEKQDAVQAYGQYNGTNLPKTYPDIGAAPDRDTDYKPPEQIPEGGQTPNTPSGGSGLPGSGGTGGTGNVSGGGGAAPTEPVEDLEFYKTLSLAISDARSGKIGESADANQADALFGVVDNKDGTCSIKILKDTTIDNETVFIAPGGGFSEIYFDLNGKNLTMTDCTLAVINSRIIDSSNGNALLKFDDPGSMGIDKRVNEWVMMNVGEGEYRFGKVVLKSNATSGDYNGNGKIEKRFNFNFDFEQTSPFFLQSLQDGTWQENNWDLVAGFKCTKTEYSVRFTQADIDWMLSNRTEQETLTNETYASYELTFFVKITTPVAPHFSMITTADGQQVI